MTRDSEIDRYLGCLLRLPAGDPFGTTLEFRHPGSFQPIDYMVSGGPFRLEPRKWTDDTSMELRLAEFTKAWMDGDKTRIPARQAAEGGPDSA